jgi:hypothetical protein
MSADTDDQAADEIAYLCGRLPLAICLAGRALQNTPGLSVTDYARRLGNETERIRLLDQGRIFSPDLETIEATILTSVSLLPATLADRWLELAVFPSDFDYTAAAVIWGTLTESTPPDRVQLLVDQTRDILADLTRFSTVEFDVITGRFRLHDLMRTVAAALTLQPARMAAEVRHAQYYR